MVAAVTQQDRLAPFRARLADFKIGEPIKSLFRPVFRVDYNWSYDKIQVQLQITAPDALAELDHLIPVVLDKEVKSSKEITPQFLREMLHFILIHEADESISWKGARIFDPHRPRPEDFND